MEKKQYENPAWGGRFYESPSSEVIEVFAEGILCESKNGGIGQLTEKDYDGLF